MSAFASLGDKPTELHDARQSGICIVSFDGDGPGSISQLLMIKDFMRKLAFELDVDEGTLRPADYWDFMGGVGFGGFTALLLGRLGMSVDDAMEELATIGNVVFLHEARETSTPEESMIRLRQSLEDMLRRHRLSVDIKLNDRSTRHCKVVAFASTTLTRFHCHPFRTYSSRCAGTECTFVEAACAILATPGSLSPVAIGPRWGKQMFVGAPLGFHNPLRQVLREARSVFNEEQQVSLLLSLGSGRATVAFLTVATASSSQIGSLACAVHDSERVAAELSDQLFGVRAYLRLNVEQGMEQVKMCDWHELQLGSIVAHTNVYLQMPTTMSAIDASSRLLQDRSGSITLGQLNRSGAMVWAQMHPEKNSNPFSVKQMRDIVQDVLGITLVDAIGNRIPIPLELCRTYQMLAGVIGVYFREQRPLGSDFVERGDYKLVSGGRRSMVEPAQWTYTVKPAITVEMSMLIRKRNEREVTCPRCGSLFQGQAENGWVTWKVPTRQPCAERTYTVCSLSCSGQFQVEDRRLESKGEGENDDIASPSILSHANPELTTVVGSGGVQADGRDKFRLISVINLLTPIPASILRQHEELMPLPAATEEITIASMPTPTLRDQPPTSPEIRSTPGVVFLLSQPSVPPAVPPSRSGPLAAHSHSSPRHTQHSNQHHSYQNGTTNSYRHPFVPQLPALVNGDMDLSLADGIVEVDRNNNPIRQHRVSHFQQNSHPDRMVIDPIDANNPAGKSGMFGFGKKLAGSMFRRDGKQTFLAPVEEITFASRSTPSLKDTPSTSAESRSLPEVVSPLSQLPAPPPVPLPPPVLPPTDPKKLKEQERLLREAEKEKRANLERLQRERSRAVVAKRNQFGQATKSPPFEFQSVNAGRLAAHPKTKVSKEHPDAFPEVPAGVVAANGYGANAHKAGAKRTLQHVNSAILATAYDQRTPKWKKEDDDEQSMSSSDVQSIGRMSVISFATVDSDTEGGGEGETSKLGAPST